MAASGQSVLDRGLQEIEQGVQALFGVEAEDEVVAATEDKPKPARKPRATKPKAEQAAVEAPEAASSPKKTKPTWRRLFGGAGRTQEKNAMGVAPKPPM